MDHMIFFHLTQGEPGQNATKSFSDEESAIKEFKKKFHDKTKNNWDDREKFNPVPGKYTLIEVEQINETEMADTFKKVSQKGPSVIIA